MTRAAGATPSPPATPRRTQRLLLCALRDFPGFAISDPACCLATPVRLLVSAFPPPGSPQCSPAEAAAAGLAPGQHVGAWMQGVLSDPSLHKHAGATPAAGARWFAAVSASARAVLDPAASAAGVTRALHDLADLVQGYRDPAAEEGEVPGEGSQAGGAVRREGDADPEVVAQGY